MKKSWKRIAAISCTAMLLTGVFALSSCSISAYDLAVKHENFQGNEEEWLKSLRGEDGKDGENVDIMDIYQAALDEGLVTDFADFLNKYLILEVNENNDTKTIANAAASVVSVYCGFSKSVKVNNAYFHKTVTAVTASAGSGVIVDLNKEAGNAYIITNYHVLYNSDWSMMPDTICLYPYGAKEYFSICDSNEDGYLDSGYSASDMGDQGGDGIVATYVGGAMDYDIAILKVQGSENLTKSVAVEAEMGDSDTLTLGEKVYAIGNANALGISVTEGIVSVESEYISMSATDNRDLNGDGKVDSVKYRVIRTSALINHGNSGGALFNLNGELIGITNAKNVEDETEGIGYALPITQVKYALQNIWDNGGSQGEGKILRAWLGVETYINESVASFDENGNLTIKETICISNPSAAVGAANGKFQIGDIIRSITIDGETTDITRNYQITDLMLKVRKNDTITITVSRENGDSVSDVDLEITFDKDDYFITYA